MRLVPCSTPRTPLLKLFYRRLPSYIGFRYENYFPKTPFVKKKLLRRVRIKKTLGTTSGPCSPLGTASSAHFHARPLPSPLPLGLPQLAVAACLVPRPTPQVDAHDASSVCHPLVSLTVDLLPQLPPLNRL
jgi:hypothetical protein